MRVEIRSLPNRSIHRAQPRGPRSHAGVADHGFLRQIFGRSPFEVEFIAGLVVEFRGGGEVPTGSGIEPSKGPEQINCRAVQRYVG
jgi:hypothetical protein